MTNEELSLKTKRSLVAALKNAMEKKPLSKVTVTELVKECQINRKTFYYYFDNIYELLKWMLEQEAIDIVKNFDYVVDTEEVFRFIMNYIDENKHIINCAYDSMGHEEIKRFLYNDLISVMKSAINQGEEELNIHVDPAFKDFLAVFFTEAAAGIIIDWIKNKFQRDKEVVLQDMLLIFKISMPHKLLAKANGITEI